MPSIKQVSEDLATVAGDRVDDVISRVRIITGEAFPSANTLLVKSPLGVFIRKDGAAGVCLPDKKVGDFGTVVLKTEELDREPAGVPIHELAHAWCAKCDGLNPGAAARLFEMDWLARLRNGDTVTGRYLRQNLEAYVRRRIGEWKRSPTNKDYFVFMLNRCKLGQLASIWP